MPDISVTREVSHFDMSRLKDEQDENRLDMLVTCDVSQLVMSPLKIGKAVARDRLISITRLVSQFGIRPYFVVVSPYTEHRPKNGSSAKHLSNASSKVALVRQTSDLHEQLRRGPESLSEHVNFD